MIAIGIVSKILFESAEIQIFRLTSGKHNFRVVSKLLSIAKGEAVADQHFIVNYNSRIEF